MLEILRKLAASGLKISRRVVSTFWSIGMISVPALRIFTMIQEQVAVIAIIKMTVGDKIGIAKSNYIWPWIYGGDVPLTICLLL